MKKIIRTVMLMAIVSVFAVNASQAQEIVVGIRPERPREVIIERPVRPSFRHVWVAEEWTAVGGRYVYHPGYWVIPPRPRAIWVRGHWVPRRHGYVWIGGYWR